MFCSREITFLFPTTVCYLGTIFNNCIKCLCFVRILLPTRDIILATNRWGRIRFFCILWLLKQMWTLHVPSTYILNCSLFIFRTKDSNVIHFRHRREFFQFMKFLFLGLHFCLGWLFLWRTQTPSKQQRWNEIWKSGERQEALPSHSTTNDQPEWNLIQHEVNWNWV